MFPRVTRFGMPRVLLLSTDEKSFDLGNWAKGEARRVDLSDP